MTEQVARTLYEDWQLRRQRLPDEFASGQGHLPLQARLLDYLLKRYAGTPEASRAPRFPFRSKLLVNRRAILVHHHLGGGVIAGVKNSEESQARLAGILSRMATVHAHADLKAPSDGAVLGHQDGLLTGLAAIGGLIAPTRASVQHAIAGALSSRNRFAICQELDKALRLGVPLPERALRHLFERIQRNEGGILREVELLTRCRSDGAFAYAILAWRERLEKFGKDAIAVMLEHALEKRLKESPSLRRLDSFRARLADDTPLVRKQTTRILGSIGTLDDIGLFFDLQTLPESEFADAEERALLQEAAERLAEASHNRV